MSLAVVLLSSILINGVLGLSVVTGPAIDYQISWIPDVESKVLHVCFSALADQGDYLALGFSSTERGRGMQDADIVAGWITDGNTNVQVFYSIRPSGIPDGQPTLEIFETSAVWNDGKLIVCFSRPLKSGHHDVSDDGGVIWARGKVENGTIAYHGKDNTDASGKTQSHRSCDVAPVPWLSGPPLKYSVEVGPAISFSIAWTPNNENGVDICYSAEASDGEYVALGFSLTNSARMLNADIVAGWIDKGKPVVKTYFSNAPEGRPSSPSSMVLSDASVSYADGVLEVCFTRPIQSGQVTLTDAGHIIWARGNVTAGDISYHGSDSPDAPGEMKTHASDDTPDIPWLSGPANPPPPPPPADKPTHWHIVVIIFALLVIICAPVGYAYHVNKPRRVRSGYNAI